MGVRTFLVSDEKKEFCDLGKVFLDDDIVEKMKAKPSRGELAKWLRESEDDLNYKFSTATEPDEIAEIAVGWMEKYPDWQFISEAHDEYDGYYLADNKADAKEMLEEFDGDAGEMVICMKTASVWSDMADEEPYNKSDDSDDAEDDEND